MWNPRFFQLEEKVLPEVVDLLTEVTLGTTGVRYKHLDTEKRVQEVDHPLFFYLKRNEKVLANITFCRRDSDWYIRYFAFRTVFQRSSETKTIDKSSSILKSEIAQFFSAALDGEINASKVNRFYAYIDPKNDRSKWMSTNFGFQTIAHLATQTFSRIYAKKSKRFQLSEPTEELISLVRKQFNEHTFYFEAFLDKNKYGVLYNDEKEIIAFCRVSMAHWNIESLGGRNGELKAKFIAKIPIVNRLIYPPLHTFVVPDSVWVKDDNPQILTELYESLIAETKANMLIWWTDQEEPLYKSVQKKINWGPMHRVLGVSPVDVVCKSKEEKMDNLKKPVYVVAIDAI